MPQTLEHPAQVEKDFLPLNGTDYVEFYVGNARQAAHYYRTAFGFRLAAYQGPETGRRDRASYVLAQNKIVSCAHQLIRYTELEPKLFICQNNAIGFIDHEDAINGRISLRLQQRVFEQQCFLGLLALSDVAHGG